MIDFTSCKKTKKTYEGANGNKICIEYNGNLYMLKFPAIPSKNKEMSYSNSCISEYIGCHIFEMLDIPVQKTLLGKYNGNKEKIVVACGDLEKDGYVLKNFASLKNTVIDSAHNGYGTELQDILDSIDMQQNIDVSTLKTRFWDMFIVDAFIGNFDRHNGNWGFLYNNQTDDFKLAPVYDCGSCLYPQADKNLVKEILASAMEIHNRVYNFPTSAIKNNDKKINYRDFLLSVEDVDCINSIIKIVPKIELEKIDNFIKSIEYLEDIQKTFYTTMLKERYELILEPALERAKNKLKSSKKDSANKEQDNDQDDIKQDDLDEEDKEI